MNLPKEIKILDVVYKIEYVDKPSDVDLYKRESLWGQCDYWTRTIRVYDGGRQESDIWQTLWHEVFHALTSKLDIDLPDGTKLESNEKIIDLLATGVNCIFQDNDWESV